ncbi:sugar phosphate isomerase/epimerase family protein [Dactylosporangium sucinum]|uniref:Sugar phosphate isomerase n=1 Tax=Dactylosporangium sucinum TaxID=1424081 RepID=A0A917WH43_9ACTN|nr:TIM barrel protein [Dactylosporangium sucinum]GGM02890.1 sugar phosphate isomerase [Dactylosporangium sucinum]
MGTLITGLCSVTLRRHPAAEVVALAAAARLETIEWAGDLHAPPGDRATAADLRARTADAGLSVAAYGSYLRAGSTDPAEISATVGTATALGAPRIRIWAGTEASADATGSRRAAVAADTRRMCDEAADAGITVAFECHARTLTDDPASTLSLLADVARPNVGTYWQPPNGMPDAAALDTLDALLPHVAAVHAFSWWPGTHRRRLHERRHLWQAAAARLRTDVRSRDVLLEFVPDDEPTLVVPEAATLRRLLRP